jgi:hypothetical protein
MSRLDAFRFPFRWKRRILNTASAALIPSVISLTPLFLCADACVPGVACKLGVKWSAT